MSARRAVVLALALVGCRSRPQPAPVVDAAVERRAAPVVQPAPAPRTGFGGRWTGACSLTVRCGREPQSVDQDELDLAIEQEGRTLRVVRDGCTYLFDLRGRGATLRAGQRCAGAGEQVSSWTLTLAPGDQEVSVTMVSRLEASPNDACEARRRGVLTRG